MDEITSVAGGETSAAEKRLTRRAFIAGAVGVAAGAAAAVAGGIYAYAYEPEQIRLERVVVPVPDLPASLDGFTIGVLADLHLGPLVPLERVHDAARRMADLGTDLVVVAGDFITAPVREAELEEVLSPIRGAYGVMGNHDYDDPVVVARQTAVRILVNEGVLAAPGLWLAGVDDGLEGRPDIGRALAGAPEGAVRILLAHEPDLADRVRPEHRVALQISGHSHGGQVRLPGVGPIVLPRLGRKYHTGLNRAPACRIYTSRGIGVTHLPVRLLCPPEITQITLRRA